MLFKFATCLEPVLHCFRCSALFSHKFQVLVKMPKNCEKSLSPLSADPIKIPLCVPSPPNSQPSDGGPPTTFNGFRRWEGEGETFLSFDSF